MTDFGLTKQLSSDAEATRTGMVLGTLDYVAPEQIRGEAIGPFTDVYSLGCMLTHLLTGEVPFTVPTEEGSCGRTSPSRRRSRARARPGSAPRSTRSSRGR